MKRRNPYLVFLSQQAEVLQDWADMIDGWTAGSAR